MGPYKLKNKSFLNYPKKRIQQRIHAIEHIVKLLVDVPMTAIVATATQANRDTNDLLES